jgi:hypothetical protein
VNIAVWVKHSGWEGSYSARNHFLGLLYASVLYAKDNAKKPTSLLTRQWQQALLNIFGWMSAIVGWQYPYICFELVHAWTLVLVLVQIFQERVQDRKLEQKNG